MEKNRMKAQSWEKTTSVVLLPGNYLKFHLCIVLVDEVTPGNTLQAMMRGRNPNLTKVRMPRNHFARSPGLGH